MIQGAGKRVFFVAGLTLVVAGSFELFVGIAQDGLGEAAFVELARGFLLLFPGYSFIAYSLHPSISMSARTNTVAPVDGEEAVAPMPPFADEIALADNVVLFPRRDGFERLPGPDSRNYR
jgi:hypothetical protein